MPTNNHGKKPVKVEIAAARSNIKLIELTFAIFGFGLGIMLFLLPKTRLVIILLLFLMFFLFEYLIWNALKNFNRLRGICTILLMLVLIFAGLYVWPSVVITPDKIRISSNVGETVIIDNEKTNDIFEVYLKITSPINRCLDLNNIEIIPEGRGELINEEKIPGASVDLSHLVLNYCKADPPFIYLIIYRLKGSHSKIIKIKKRDSEKGTDQLDLSLAIVKFSSFPPRPVSLENGAGIVLNPPDGEPIAVTISAKRKTVGE